MVDELHDYNFALNAEENTLGVCDVVEGATRIYKGGLGDNFDGSVFPIFRVTGDLDTP